MKKYPKKSKLKLPKAADGVDMEDFAPSLQLDPNTKQNGSIMNILGKTHEEGGTELDTNNSGQATLEAELNETTDGKFMYSDNLGYNKDKLPTIKPKDVKVTFADKTKQIESKFSRKNPDDTIANNTKDIEMNRVKTDNQTAKQFVDVLAAIKSQKKVMKNGGYLPKALNGQTIETTESGSFGGLNWGNATEQKIEDNARPVDDLPTMEQTSIASVNAPAGGYNFNPNAQISAGGYNFNPNAQISTASPGSSEYLSTSISGAASSVPGSIAYAQAHKQNSIKGNSKAIRDYNNFDKASTSTGTKVGRGIGIAALNFVPFVGPILASAGSAGVDAMVDARRKRLRDKAEASYEFLNREKTVNDEGVVVSKNGGHLPKAKNGFNWSDEDTYNFGKLAELGLKGASVAGPVDKQKLYKDNSLITKQQLLPNYGQANLNYNTAASILQGASPQQRAANLANLYATSQQTQNDYDVNLQNQNAGLTTQYEARKSAQTQYNNASKLNTDTINSQNQAGARNVRRQFLTDAGNYVNNKYEFAGANRSNKLGYKTLNSLYPNFQLADYNTLINSGWDDNTLAVLFKKGLTPADLKAKK